MNIRATLLLLAGLLGGCSDSDVPSDSPYKRQAAETFSMQLKESRIIDRQKNLHWFQEYVSGYEPPDAAKLPARLTPLQQIKSCAVPKPAAGSRVVEVITWNSKVYAPVYMIDEEKLTKITKNVMAVIDNDNSPELALAKREGQLLQIDVAVMPSVDDIHLVLASKGPVLWNLVAQDGARISGVTLISKSSTVAIANAPADTSVVAIAGDVAEKCGAVPALMPVREYPGVKMQLHKANENDAKYAEALAKYKAYNRYFKQQFGEDSDDVAIGTSVMNHAVVGDVPQSLDARLPFKTLEGSQIRATPAAFVMAGSEADYLAAKKATIFERAKKMSGKNYNPHLDQAGG